MRYFLIILAFASGLAATVGARAEYEPRECGGLFPDGQTKEQFFAALAQLDRCQRNFMGVVPIEQRAAAGESVVRAYIQRGERSLPLFIEYVRAADGRTWLDVRTDAPNKPRLETAISQAEFSRVQARWREQAAVSAVGRANYDKKKVDKKKSGIEVVCIGYSSATVEVAEAGRTERAELDGCKPWDFTFADFLVSQALQNADHCAPDNPDSTDGDRLMACLCKRHDDRQ